MSDLCEPEFNTQLGTENLELVVIELLPVICNQGMWDAESAYDFFPEEVLNPSLSDGRDCFHFYPLCEVVYGYN